MEISKKYSNSEIRKNIFKMIFPIMGANILEMLVGLVSMALIGNLGFIAIGAMGLSTRVRGILWSVFKGIAIGGQVVVAQAFGYGDDKKVKKVLSQTVLSIFLLSLFFLLTILLFPEIWLKIFGAQGELLRVGVGVLKIMGFGIPFLGIVIVVSGILQGKGDAITPMIIGIVMNVLNCFLGIILVHGFLGIKPMGLTGAAIAMSLSQMMAAIFALVILFLKDDLLKNVKLKDLFIFSKDIIYPVYKTGIPSVLESLFWQLSSIIVIRAILTYGDAVYAAYQLGLQAESIAFMPAAGFSVASTTYIGNCIGAGDKETAKKYFKEIMKGSILISAIGGGLLVFFPSQILGIMTKDISLIEISTVYIFICGLAQVPQNIAGVMGGALKGSGYTKEPMYSAAIGLYGIRIPITLFFSYIIHGSFNVIFLAIGIDMAMRLIINGYFYKKINVYDNPRIV
jgi:putative MATE family efflux protein